MPIRRIAPTNTLTFALALAALAVLPAAAFAGPEPTDRIDRSGSPYFFIDGGDPAIDRLPLERTSVDVHVAGVIAAVTVHQLYKNDGSRPIHARYVFPASTRAAVNGLRLRVGDDVVEARIRRRDEARQEFEEAKHAGHSATLLEEDRPNVFTMNVANVMPGDRIDVELRYSELLVPNGGVYELVYPTVVGPRYAKGGEAYVSTPFLHAGAAAPSALELHARVDGGMPLQELSSPSHRVATTFAANRAHADMTLEEPAGGDRDVILRWRLAGAAITTGLLIDDDGYFLLMAQPPARIATDDVPPREYVFILDVSGSMSGFPLGTAKDLLADLIVHLRPTDTFNVILFSGGSRILAPRSIPATPENVERAVHVIDHEQGGGGTELLPALHEVLELARVGTGSRTLVVITDGYIDAEREVFTTIRDHLDDTNVFAFGIGTAVNRYLIEGIARAGLGEAFVVSDSVRAGEAARRFRAYIESPVLTHVRLEAEGLEVSDVEPAHIPDLFADRPIVVQGKWHGARRGTLRLTGATGAGAWTQGVDVATVTPGATPGTLATLWARARIATLSDLGFGPEDPARKAAVTELGLAYNLMTRYTSFIAVHHAIRNPGAPGADVDQPVPLPQGVSDAAVPVTQGDEPGLALLLAVFLAIVAAAFLARPRPELRP